MRKLIPLKLLSWLLLAITLTVTVNCVISSAHALEREAAAAGQLVSQCQVSDAHHCPCAPAGGLHDHDQDDCDDCCGCACHLSLITEHFHFSYNPVMSDLQVSDPFQYLPEVYLPKFIPPQNQA